MYSKTLLAIGCAAALSAHGPLARAADVVIGVPDWPSALAMAHVLEAALEKNLGLDVELREGTNQAVFDAMDAGSMHVHPEVWQPNHDHFTERFVDARQSVRLGANAVTGEQAMCVTRGTAERTGIVSLSELAEPEMAARFDTDGDGRGEIWIGAPSWASTTVERIRARSYGYDDTMTLDDSDESVALAAVADAIDDGENVVFFCYSPHHMFETYDLVVLEEPAHEAKRWRIVQPSDLPGWLEKSSADVAWDTASLRVGYAASLETDLPEAAAMLANVSLDTDTVSAMTHALVVEQRDPAEFAANWVEENAETVSAWLR